MIVQEPLITREELSEAVAGGAGTDIVSFELLGRQRAVSSGLTLSSGHRVHSRLVREAGLSARRRHWNAAREWATAAAEVERSEPAAVVAQAMRDAMASPRGARPSVIGGQDVDVGSIWREIGVDEAYRGLLRALERLTEEATHAVAESTGSTPAIWTSLGVVQRLSPIDAELQMADGTRRLLKRAELTRKGLDVVGQHVAVLEEQGGPQGSRSIYVPAIDLDDPAPRSGRFEPFAIEGRLDLDDADRAFLAHARRTVPRRRLPQRRT